MAAGNIAQKYHSKYIERISGVLRAMPVTGGIFLVAAMAVAGAPPFSIFISEFTIMMAGVEAGLLWVSCALASLVVLIFAGMTYYVVRMAFGEIPTRIGAKRTDAWMRCAMAIPLIFLVLCGLYVPEIIQQSISLAAGMLEGGAK